MNDLMNFRKWLKSALKTRLMFTIEETNYIVTDGYVAYLLKNKKYIDELRMQTFQDLDKNFHIQYRKINFEAGNVNLLDIFSASKEVKATPVYIGLPERKIGKNSKARLFTIDNTQVFVNEEYLNYININNYQIYGTDELTPLVFKSKDVDFAALPIRNASRGMKISILH
jgi:hypothetical protein